jgi:hypothetical protein
LLLNNEVALRVQVVQIGAYWNSNSKGSRDARDGSMFSEIHYEQGGNEIDYGSNDNVGGIKPVVRIA